MKHYLLVFNRRSGSIVRFSEFAQANEALTARFDAETEFMDDANIEVVVLGAASKDALRRTHGRYFHGAREMAGSALGKLRKYEANSRVRLAI
jgi:hypothetical protein